jgi:hypothetical protein
MKFQEANKIAKDWLDSLKLPKDLTGKQVNIYSYLDERGDTPLFWAKKKYLGIELKRRGARVIGEIDYWTDEQSEFVCKYYIAQLKKHLLSKEPQKQQVAKNYLMSELGKSSKAVRLKLHHISSILVNSDLPYLESFKPIPRAEIDLIDWNETNVLKKILLEEFNEPDFLDFLSSLSAKTEYSTEVTKEIQVEQPPDEDVFEHLENADQPSLRIRPKINYVEREIRNTKLGEAGETWVINFERQRLLAEGREDLANKIVWASKDVGDGLGFDIISYNSSGDKVYIEVKTTCLGKFSAFYLTQKEIQTSLKLGVSYYIYRVFDFNKETKLFTIENSLADSLDLVPTTFRATVKKTNAQQGIA